MIYLLSEYLICLFLAETACVLTLTQLSYILDSYVLENHNITHKLCMIGWHYMLTNGMSYVTNRTNLRIFTMLFVQLLVDVGLGCGGCADCQENRRDHIYEHITCPCHQQTLSLQKILSCGDCMMLCMLLCCILICYRIQKQRHV